VHGDRAVVPSRRQDVHQAVAVEIYRVYPIGTVDRVVDDELGEASNDARQDGTKQAAANHAGNA
jgi:hypothetical protein